MNPPRAPRSGVESEVSRGGRVRACGPARGCSQWRSPRPEHPHGRDGPGTLLSTTPILDPTGHKIIPGTAIVDDGHVYVTSTTGIYDLTTS
ncbi:hypothetical protein GCM10009810_38420 [Nostocoides vanveenii]|uniref:Uncharacterized protein n=1 Tax=Nostocoides vanveenii TaxID=330835 RepID=A0ABN2L7R5_9MICO